MQARTQQLYIATKKNAISIWKINQLAYVQWSSQKNSVMQ